MKKKLSVFISILILVSLLPVPARAAGRGLIVSSKNVVVTEEKDGVTVYAFARLENNARNAVTFDSGRFDVYSTAGELLGTDDKPAVYAAKYLSFGEYGYLKAYVSLENVAPAEIGECALTVEGKEYKGRAKIERYACAPVYEEGVVYGGWLTYDYMGADVTNGTEQVLYDVEAVFALLGEDGTIWNIGYAFLGVLNDVGLYPGSTVRLRDINSCAVQEAYKNAGQEISSLDAIVYREIYV